MHIEPNALNDIIEQPQPHPPQAFIEQFPTIDASHLHRKKITKSDLKEFRFRVSVVDQRLQNIAHNHELRMYNGRKLGVRVVIFLNGHRSNCTCIFKRGTQGGSFLSSSWFTDQTPEVKEALLELQTRNGLINIWYGRRWNRPLFAMAEAPAV